MAGQGLLSCRQLFCKQVRADTSNSGHFLLDYLRGRPAIPAGHRCITSIMQMACTSLHAQHSIPELPAREVKYPREKYAAFVRPKYFQKYCLKPTQIISLVPGVSAPLQEQVRTDRRPSQLWMRRCITDAAAMNINK